jgi:hypothetical protein
VGAPCSTLIFQYEGGEEILSINSFHRGWSVGRSVGELSSAIILER